MQPCGTETFFFFVFRQGPYVVLAVLEFIRPDLPLPPKRVHSMINMFLLKWFLTGEGQNDDKTFDLYKNVYLWKCSLVSSFIDITGTRCKQLKILGIVLENRTFIVGVNE